MFQQMEPCLNGKQVDRPGHTVSTQTVQQVGGAGDISQSQTGNGITLGHGVQQQDVGKLRSLGSREKRTQGEKLVGLVDDETYLRIMTDKCCQIFLLHNRSGRVIGIAQPQHAHLFRQAIPLALRRKPIEGSDPMAVHAAGIGIFTESGLHNGGVCPAESLCGKIDGFGSSVRHAHCLGRKTVAAGKAGLKRVRLRFGIVADAVNPGTQMRLQGREVHPAVNVRAEVCRNGTAVFIGIVSVSFNHGSLSIFGR